MKQRTPISQKNGANVLTTHHVLFERHLWVSKAGIYNDLRTHGAFLVDLTRADHDFLHTAIHPVLPPVKDVAYEMRDIVQEVRNIRDPIERLTQIATDLGHLATSSHSPEFADDALIVALNLFSQVGVMINIDNLR